MSEDEIREKEYLDIRIKLAREHNRLRNKINYKKNREKIIKHNTEYIKKKEKKKLLQNQLNNYFKYYFINET
jgi:hypothetical protein